MCLCHLLMGYWKAKVCVARCIWLKSQSKCLWTVLTAAVDYVAQSTDFDGQEKPVVMVIVTKVPVRQSGVNVGRTENLRFNEWRLLKESTVFCQKPCLQSYQENCIQTMVFIMRKCTGLHVRANNPEKTFSACRWLVHAQILHGDHTRQLISYNITCFVSLYARLTQHHCDQEQTHPLVGIIIRQNTIKLLLQKRINKK